jgi:hypothetical protein
MTKKKQNKRKFKWCMDYLLIGYIFQTILLLLIVCSGDDMSGINWPLFMLIPYGIWGLEMLKVNLR